MNINVFWYSSHVFIDLFFKVVMNLSATTDFCLLCVECISISCFSTHEFLDLLQNLLPLSIHILFGLQFDSSKIL